VAKPGSLSKKPNVTIAIDAVPNGKWKTLGGSNRNQWNDRLSTLVTRALPVDQKNVEAVSHAGSAAAAGIVDMNPADPIEGVLISQIVVANEAALNLYRLGWANVTEYFEAGTKFLQLADRASRTAAILTERLEQHRNRGQQQIVVKHVTVNADQAVVTDNIVAGKTTGHTKPSPALLTDSPATSMPTLDDVREAEPVGVRKRNEQQPHAQSPRCPTVHCQIKTDWPALSCACGPRLAGLPNARGPWWCSCWQRQRELQAWCPLEGNDGALETY